MVPLQSRRFTLSDALILVAAMAVCLAFSARQAGWYVVHVLRIVRHYDQMISKTPEDQTAAHYKSYLRTERNKDLFRATMKLNYWVVLIVFVDPAPIVARAQDRKESAQAANPVAEEIQEAIIALRNTDIGNSKGWATAARRLTQIGKPAVPALIEELDRTTADRPLRSLGFTLRAIEDPRAVPARSGRYRVP